VFFILLASSCVITLCARQNNANCVSDRSGAAIASAVLQYFGIITPIDFSMVVDRSKVRKARKRKRSEMASVANLEMLFALYFDGRKDKTKSKCV